MKQSHNVSTKNISDWTFDFCTQKLSKPLYDVNLIGIFLFFSLLVWHC